MSDFIKAKGYAPSLKEISFRGRLFSLAAFYKHLTDMEEKGLVYRRKHQRKSLELESAERNAKAWKIPLLRQVNARCPIENV